MKKTFTDKLPLLVFVVLVIISFLSFKYYFQYDLITPYADAISRLNIARKVVDNITPGVAQVGNVWLPLPQILMLPFIWNNYLWHSGIAGYLMSGTAFVVGGVFIYLSAVLVTKSRLAGIFSTLIYALNINILYLQTTAMSEAIFLTSLSASMYFFLRWFHRKDRVSLVLAALSVSAMCLIRYEGLAILLPSILLVFFYSLVSSKKYKKAEGNTVIYTVLACLGFGLWTLYLTVIFGNPLYWRDYYATPQATGGAEAVYTQAKPFLVAVWQYFASFTWMIGVIPTGFAIVGTFIMFWVCYKRRSWDFLVFMMPLSIFLFMVMTLQRNTPVVQPDLNLKNILSGETSLMTGFNIRYGLLLLPWVAIISSYLLIVKNIYIKTTIFVVLLSIFGLQVCSYFRMQYTVIYQIPARIYEKPFAKSVKWLQDNYDGGKILISAASQEDQMFAMGFNYSTFIHEGAGKYWKESLDNPSRYAKWVVIDYGHNSDNLAKHMNREDILEREYKLVYQEKQLKIFKKITNPYFEL